MIAFENQVSHSTDFQSLSDDQNDVYLFRTILQSEVVIAKKIDAETLWHRLFKFCSVALDDSP